jgi:glutamate--cysteine ligase
VRLKRIIEVRGADTVPRELICALPAVWKGLLYDADALAATWELLGGTTEAELDAGQLDVAARGLRAEMSGKKVLDMAREIVSYSAEGLKRISKSGFSPSDESGFLDPLVEQIEKGISPGEEVANSWRGEWGHNREKLIAATRY